MSEFTVVLLACSLFLGLAAAVAAILSLISIKKMQNNMHVVVDELKAAENKIAEVNKSAVWIFERLMKTEKKITELTKQQEELVTEQVAAEDQEPVVEPAPMEDNYDRAVSLIEQGLDSFELSERLGLSESEAKLMIMMNKSQKGL